MFDNIGQGKRSLREKISQNHTQCLRVKLCCSESVDMSSLGRTEGLSVFALLITPDYAFYPSNCNEGPFNINVPEQVSVTAIYLFTYICSCMSRKLCGYTQI